jgi:hypothetical protein
MKFMQYIPIAASPQTHSIAIICLAVSFKLPAFAYHLNLQQLIIQFHTKFPLFQRLI